MAKTIFDARHLALVHIIRAKRLAADMRQEELAEAMGKKQPFIAKLESGDRRIDVVELLELGRVLGFDPKDVLDQLAEKPHK